MRQARIQGIHARRKVPITRRNPAQSAAPNLVCRELTAGFLYLAAVIDVWSKRVVGWSMRDDMATPLVTDTPNMAITTRQPDRVIHHSDRGNTCPSVSRAASPKPASNSPSGRSGIPTITL